MNMRNKQSKILRSLTGCHGSMSSDWEAQSTQHLRPCLWRIPSLMRHSCQQGPTLSDASPVLGDKHGASFSTFFIHNDNMHHGTFTVCGSREWTIWLKGMIYIDKRHKILNGLLVILRMVFSQLMENINSKSPSHLLFWYVLVRIWRKCTGQKEIIIFTMWQFIFWFMFGADTVLDFLLMEYPHPAVLKLPNQFGSSFCVLHLTPRIQGERRSFVNGAMEVQLQCG